LYVIVSTNGLVRKVSDNQQDAQLKNLENDVFGEHPIYLRSKIGRKKAISLQLPTYSSILNELNSQVGTYPHIFIPLPQDIDDAFMFQFNKVRSTLPSSRIFPFSLDHQMHYLRSKGRDCVSSLFGLESISAPEWITRLFQICLLYQHGGIYIDLSEIQLLHPIDYVLETIITMSNPTTYPTLLRNQRESMISYQFMWFPKPKHNILYSLLRQLNESKPWLDNSSDISWFDTTLYKCSEMSRLSDSGNFIVLEQECLPTVHDLTSEGLLLDVCPDLISNFCCQVSLDANHISRVLFSTSYINPRQHKALSNGIIPSLTQIGKEIATVVEETHEKPNTFPKTTPNFYNMMQANDCLPTNRHCVRCLSIEGSCTDECRKVCPCYCSALCHAQVPEKFVSRTFKVVPPFSGGSARQGMKPKNRLIPKIIHQIWVEPELHILGDNPHPELSRIINTWKNSGWDHRVYHLQKDIPTFLTAHFPAEVLEAYNAILPLRFKSDFARICLLLIYGGVYADPDVLLTVKLDNAITHDVGFIAAIDVVSTKTPDTRESSSPCLSNELIASSPAHPFLAKALEFIVNGVRNRFTSVDYDNFQCPSPPLNLTLFYAKHFTTGSCVLGSAVNEVLGRPKSTHFRNSDTLPSLDIGRSILLQSKHKDMGTLRFTLTDQNILLGSRMRKDVSNWPENYSYSSIMSGINSSNNVYGTRGIYANPYSANEKITISVVL